MHTTEATARAKSELRLKARAARRAITPEQRTESARKLTLMLTSLPELREVRAVLSYEPLSEELDPRDAAEQLRRRGVRIALPRVLDAHRLQLHWFEPGDPLQKSMYGTLEPLPVAPVAPVAAMDAILTPGVAYDRLGHRLGFGAGYYDRLFAEIHGSVLRVGVAYEEQVYPELPHDDLDQPVHIVVTPRFVYRPN